VIERNFISASHVGIEIGNCIVKNNTIESGKLIVVQASSKPTIIYNNFPYAYVAGVDGITLAQGASLAGDASYNWWGTTDIETINQSIFDVKNDFNLGTVNFIPFLTEPNPQAMPDSDAVIPTNPATTPSNTPTTPTTSTQPTTTQANNQNTQQIEFYQLTIIMLVAVIAVLAVALIRRHSKQNTKTKQ